MQDKILDISKRRGIIYPSFEIYGGLAGFYDYGPVGKRIKENVENLIREFYVIDEGFMEVECPTLSPEEVWVASGHIENFADLMTECKKCGAPYRADHLVEAHLKKAVDGLGIKELEALIEKEKISCPKCKGELDKIYNYNLMFQTSVGPGKEKKTSYLRPETAQTTYLAFRRLWEIGRKKLPLGVLQIGRSFRNEISPRQGVIRLREFNQAEIQIFVDPDEKDTEEFKNVSKIKVRILDKNDKESDTSLGDAVKKGVIKSRLIAYHLGRALQLFEAMGIDPKRLKLRQHRDEERAFYSTDTWDVEFQSGDFGRVELVGISDRTDYDLKAHQDLSGQSMEVNIDGKKFIPHVIEIAYGVDRPVYCVIESCYAEDDRGTYFKFPKRTAPYQAAVFPLVNKDKIPEKAREIFNSLKQARIFALYDKGGSIGRRYARADEIGIPSCITIDYDTLEDGTVTVRDRDSKKQERVKIEELSKRIL
ncbi:MAG: glycine--tRNA ligase [Candidatus Altiarchaeales archaeon]|nr:glycine--tRNA ligase [Candidatus Altiarchaeota archaeon]MCG2783294.1 glycine--tRNA ligase [Candidatus Altiarchaeales archaeon]MBU4265850.1 glycine--tRNA ligase [Candidatus Altiarchaeota archaeon]MBU4341299.1 glycine--tRNA ligase [Candidatus Altiarchaeota archaeon]MBU4406740.1 glycine--tRNA ligase [Candidatus Altiarchaeota archaeon]